MSPTPTADLTHDVLNGAGSHLPQCTVQEFAPRRTKYCVCIPVLNEGERIRRELADMKAHDIPGCADIVLVDGGSTDGSVHPDFLQFHGVRTLVVRTGPGKLSAQLRLGYAYAMRQGYEGVITVDGNDKDDVDAIPVFIHQMNAGFDLVQGSRFVPGGKAINTPLSRLLAIKLVHAPLISRVAGFPYTDTTNGFRGYSRRLLLDPRVQPFRSLFNRYELLAYMSVRGPQLGFRTCEVPVVRRYPKDSVPTKISPLRGNMELLSVLYKTARGSFNP